MSLLLLNNAKQDDVEKTLNQCCSCDAWVKNMLECKPYADANALHIAADESWSDLSEKDYLQAFDGHPKIGDVTSLKEKYAATKIMATGEQSEVEVADESVIIKLAQGNADYEKKFGFIFIVCATGKSAKEMSDLLQGRLKNNREAELKNAAEEQAKIFHIRLDKLL